MKAKREEWVKDGDIGRWEDRRWGYRAELLHAAEEEKRVGWSVAVRYLSPRLRYGKAKEVAQMKGCQPKQVIKKSHFKKSACAGFKNTLFNPHEWQARRQNCGENATWDVANVSV